MTRTERVTWIWMAPRGWMITLSLPLAGTQRCSPQHMRYHGHPREGKTECVITFARKGIMEARRWTSRRIMPSFIMVTVAFCDKSTATSTWARSMTNICAGSQRWSDV